jgi:hypothetical protein
LGPGKGAKKGAVYSEQGTSKGRKFAFSYKGSSFQVKNKPHDGDTELMSLLDSLASTITNSLFLTSTPPRRPGDSASSARLSSLNEAADFVKEDFNLLNLAISLHHQVLTQQT